MNANPRNLLFVLSIALILLAAYAYGASHLNINNNGTITIANSNLFANTSNITPSTLCATLPNSSYSDSGLSVTWPVIAQGSSGSIYICLVNKGSTPDTLNLVPGTLPSGVSFSSPQQGSALASSATILCQLTLTASSTASTGGFSFALTIT